MEKDEREIMVSLTDNELYYICDIVIPKYKKNIIHDMQQLDPCEIDVFKTIDSIMKELKIVEEILEKLKYKKSIIHLENFIDELNSEMLRETESSKLKDINLIIENAMIRLEELKSQDKY